MVRPIRYPTKRLIVFAGLSSQVTRLHAMHNRNVEAAMASFELVKKGKWWGRTAAILDQWEQFRFLDSGAFTFLRKSSSARAKRASQPKAASTKEVKDTLDYAEYKAHLQLYIAFLKERGLADFDFVFEMDMDLLTIESGGKTIPGIELTYAGRKLLKQLAGDKLIPVWHGSVRDEGYSRFKEMCREYKYVATALDSGYDPRVIQYLCHYAHSQGVLVHGLGTSKADVLEEIPFDTVDSTTWLSSVRFGQFAGWMYPRETSVNYRQQGRVPVFEEMVRKMGYDPAHLLLPGGSGITTKYEVAIALLQQRQDEAPPIPEPVLSAPMFI